MAVREYFKFVPMPIRLPTYYAYSPVDPDNAFAVNVHKRASFLLVAEHCTKYPLLGDKFYELNTAIKHVLEATRAKRLKK
jgi:hypothetical protein